jgi:hypothetical protein
MSRSQFYSIKLFILRHAWLNLWDKHMTTGRINQVTICQPPLRNDGRMPRGANELHRVQESDSHNGTPFENGSSREWIVETLECHRVNSQKRVDSLVLLSFSLCITIKQSNISRVIKSEKTFRRYTFGVSYHTQHLVLNSEGEGVVDGLTNEFSNMSTHRVSIQTLHRTDRIRTCVQKQIRLKWMMITYVLRLLRQIFSSYTSAIHHAIGLRQ